MKTTNVLIPMAGSGCRFAKAGYTLPKPLIDVNGQPMILNVIDNINDRNFRFIFCVQAAHCENHGLDTILKSKLNDCVVFKIDSPTGGSVSTCLYAKEEINNDSPLIVVNCDQMILDWDYEKLYNYININNYDGLFGVFKSTSVKNSYVKLDGNYNVIEVKEKQVISDIATTGLHYWKNGSLFVESAEEMIKNDDRTNGEFYIAPTFNYLIKSGKKIGVFEYKKHMPIGTPEDLDFYLMSFTHTFTKNHRDT